MKQTYSQVWWPVWKRSWCGWLLLHLLLECWEKRSVCFFVGSLSTNVRLRDLYWLLHITHWLLYHSFKYESLICGDWKDGSKQWGQTWLATSHQKTVLFHSRIGYQGCGDSMPYVQWNVWQTLSVETCCIKALVHLSEWNRKGSSSALIYCANDRRKQSDHLSTRHSGNEWKKKIETFDEMDA